MATNGVGEQSKFVGAKGDYTSDLRFFYPHVDSSPPVLPCFRLIDDLGRPVQGSEVAMPSLDQDYALALMHTMLRVSEFDKIYNDAQRQGRISFYLTSRGEEACSVGSAAALPLTDWMLPQYRELGAYLWRGFTFQHVADQLCANDSDPAHGRQLPLHIGSREKHILYVKSTLGTQCPHAAGAAYASKFARRDQARARARARAKARYQEYM
jgi:2-oxoisovalerate dehydrogenase E1 component alpha subunit